jgi:hypothetical protein
VPATTASRTRADRLRERIAARYRDAAIRRLRSEGASIRTIATELDWSVGTVHRVLTTYVFWVRPAATSVSRRRGGGPSFSASLLLRCTPCAGV